jgi:hypothetical protein
MVTCAGVEGVEVDIVRFRSDILSRVDKFAGGYTTDRQSRESDVGVYSTERLTTRLEIQDDDLRVRGLFIDSFIVCDKWCPATNGQVLGPGYIIRTHH